MDILEKFKEHLSAEDFVQLEESIVSLIEEKAKDRAALIVTDVKAELETLAEQYTLQEVDRLVSEKTTELEESYSSKTELFKETAIERLQELAEGFVAKEVSDKVAEIKTQLDEEYAEKIQSLEENVVDKLDKFLDLEISSKISDELLESVAINEAYAPIVNGIRDLFENKFVAIDAEGTKIVAEAKAEAETLKTKLNESMADKIELVKKVESLQTGLLIATKSEGLTESQKNRVTVMLEGKSFEEVAAKIDTVIDIISETEDVITGKTETEVINEDVFTGSVEEIVESASVESEVEKKDAEIRLDRVRYLLGE